MPSRLSLISLGDIIASVSPIFCDLHCVESLLWTLKLGAIYCFLVKRGNRSIVLIDNAIGLRLGERDTACQVSFFKKALDCDVYSGTLVSIKN